MQLLNKLRTIDFGDTPDHEVFHVLSNQRRLAVIRHMNMSDKDMFMLHDLVDAVGVAEPGMSIPLSDKDRKTLYVSIYQFHLDKLVEMEVVELHDDVIMRGNKFDKYAELANVL